jgi:phosphatidylethanolamine/phosphatidyl-N-methylethanolamine N-methyltransferase
MAGQPTLPHSSGMYHRLSGLYDPIFTLVLGPGGRRTVRSLPIPPGATVLELGVGTGLSLEAYPAHARVIGIDLSATMLERAQTKIAQHGWTHVTLRQMDAQNLEFPDSQFDLVTAFHIVTVVPDPGRLVREMVRVCKPQGTIVIVNHFRSPRPWLARIIDRLNPVTLRLGWRTTLELSELIDSTRLNVQQRYKTSAGSLFTVVVATKPADR